MKHESDCGNKPVMLKPLPIAALMLFCLAAPVAAQDKKPPYWASVVPNEANIRTGPGRNFPAIWQFRRAGLPVKVVAIFPAWRKVEDPDGAQGWMQANMLSDQRTGMVRGDVAPMRARPEGGAAIVWRASPGVVGKLRSCRDGWCDFDVKGRRGWIEARSLWGVAPGEAVEE
ncbi:SH3 domain-containing protein [Sphingomonas sp. ID1715]|uniref:SH3 domain-containing protein n=1 Tax=Sphingomonas sp. ID1715 TaxID=1656898 RepID=UPI0020C4C8F8|nr:SH3 domain-containing protein [Sphingomonas sp. ID1715]